MNRIEQGHAGPLLDDLIRISDALGVPPAELVGRPARRSFAPPVARAGRPRASAARWGVPMVWRSAMFETGDIKDWCAHEVGSGGHIIGVLEPVLADTAAPACPPTPPAAGSARGHDGPPRARPLPWDPAVAAARPPLTLESRRETR
ncbi:helix-turn-helix transcriptional regulator [Streptomyces sp. NPDC047022]|uniref:helix-turn-helix domain-containing protein n=1 Tax=Streptomyces sp. NPDC047022 TaxID=3155737 RepID=UPI0033EE01D3